MSKLTVELPETLQRSIAAFAAKEGCMVDPLPASAATETMAAIRTLDYLRQEAAKGRREDFGRFLASVPEQEPAETDRIND